MVVPGWKRVLIAFACMAFALVRLKYPDAKVDSVTVWLLGIAAAMFLLPEAQALLPYIKRVKVGDTEIELVQQLEREVEEAKESVANQMVPVGLTTVDEVLREAGRSPQAGLLLLSSRLEEQVRQRLADAGIAEGQTLMSLPRLMEKGVEKGFFSQSILSATRDFWAARNKIAHGRAFDVSDATLYSLISLGTQLLQVVSSSKPVAVSLK